MVEPEIKMVSNEVWSATTQSAPVAGAGAARVVVNPGASAISVAAHRIVPPGKSLSVDGTAALS
jgi:hypothetical protein